MDNIDSQPGPHEDLRGILILRRPPGERERARKMAFRANAGVLVFTILVCMLLGDGDLQQTRQLLSKHMTSLMCGAVFLGLMQLASQWLIGSAEFWYRFHEDRVVFHRPPRLEEVRFEEIRELRKERIDQAADPGSDQAICIAVSLKNGREIRLFGYLQMHEGWNFLASRLPEKVVESPKSGVEPLFPLSRLLWWGFLAVLWALCMVTLFSEKYAMPLTLLGYAFAPFPYLIRYHRFGRPASEDPYILGVCFLMAYFFLGATIVYFFF